MSAAARRRSCLRPGRLVPPQARSLRAGAVILAPEGAMDWHSTGAREELVVALAGRVVLEVASSASRRISRLLLRQGWCAFVPVRTRHRVVNRSRRRARYLYVTAPVSG